MTTAQGNFVVVGLGSSNPKYFWNGAELPQVVDMVVRKNDLVVLKASTTDGIDVSAMNAYGIKVKVV